MISGARRAWIGTVVLVEAARWRAFLERIRRASVADDCHFVCAVYERCWCQLQLILEVRLMAAIEARHGMSVTGHDLHLGASMPVLPMATLIVVAMRAAVVILLLDQASVAAFRLPVCAVRSRWASKRLRLSAIARSWRRVGGHGADRACRANRFSPYITHTALFSTLTAHLPC